jgi:hypothetical protein
MKPALSVTIHSVAGYRLSPQPNFRSNKAKWWMVWDEYHVFIPNPLYLNMKIDWGGCNFLKSRTP